MGLFTLSEACFKKSKDFNSLFMFYSCYGDEEGLKFVYTEAEKEGKYNIAYEAAYLLAMPEECVNILLKSKRYGEAAMFARSYCPDMLTTIMKDWSDILKQNSLPFIPENIFESRDQKAIMAKAREIYDTQIKPNLYDQPRAPADELDL
jgi:coatomer subunit beta'